MSAKNFSFKNLFKSNGIGTNDMTKPLLIASDEELNVLFKKAEIVEDDKGRLILYPLTGSEVEV